jgi:serine/threonine protein kinase
LHAAGRSSGPSCLARDKTDGGSVVIKLLDPTGLGADSAEQLLLEIRQLPARNHPALLPPLDAGRIQNLVYYVVPFVEGETLQERIQRGGGLPVSEAVRLTREIGAGLEASHRAGVVQGQLAPDNVILSERGPLVNGAGVPLAIQRSRTGPTNVESEKPTQDIQALAALLETMLAGSSRSSPEGGARSSRLGRRVQRLLGPAKSQSRRMTTSMAEFLAALARLEQPPEQGPDFGRRTAAVAIGTGFFGLGPLVEHHLGSAGRPRRHLRWRPALSRPAIPMMPS